MLKFIVKSLDEVDEAFRSLYVADGDSFRLQVDGAAPKSELEEARQKLNEFRQTNIELMKERDTGPKPEKKPDPMESALKSQIENFAKEIAALKNQLHGEAIGSKASVAFLKAGGLEDALPVAMQLITSAVTLDESGKPVVKGPDGSPLLSKTKPSEPMTMDEFISSELKSKHYYLFPKASGGGAPGSKAGGGASYDKPNPYARATLNLKEQIEVEKAQPALAARLKAEAAATAKPNQ